MQRYKTIQNSEFPNQIILCIFAEYMSMKFTLQHKDPASKARAGELATDHGVIRTPIFMPVGTAATVKGIFHRDVRDEARMRFVLFDCK